MKNSGITRFVVRSLSSQNASLEVYCSTYTEAEKIDVSTMITLKKAYFKVSTCFSCVCESIYISILFTKTNLIP